MLCSKCCFSSCKLDLSEEDSDLRQYSNGGLTLYFNNSDTMDRCYDAILECFYDAMNFCSRRKLSVIGES